MMFYQRVLLKLGQGTLETGLPNIDIQLWVSDLGLLWQGTGRLPPDKNLLALCRHWQKYYDSLCQNLGTRVLEIVPDTISNISWKEFRDLSQSLINGLQTWLEFKLFLPIYEKLLIELSKSKSDEIQILIVTEDKDIHLLPWHTWKLFNHFPQSDFAFSLPESQLVEVQRDPGEVRVLSILGINKQTLKGAGLHLQEPNITKDIELLNDLPNVKVIKELVLPQRTEITNSLWEEAIDILFFAGHSHSDDNKEIGRFRINETEEISIDQIQRGMCHSIKHGLKLAIFNSCDGLGLACQLSQLHIPYLIVMRELIPDLVAIKFLEYFLKAFCGSSRQQPTKSLYLAMREARARLEEDWDDCFPCASWLPVLFQNPTEEYLTWEILQGYYPEPVVEHNNSVVALPQSEGVQSAIPAPAIPALPIPQPSLIFDFNKFKKLRTTDEGKGRPDIRVR
ncbi:CHAT domain-containing protein [Trichothermofontia sp.]